MPTTGKVKNLLTLAFNFLSCLFRFIFIDLGGIGRHSDGGIFSNSTFGRALDDNSLILPDPSPLPGTSAPQLPYVIVGDEAFPLRNYLLRPYPGRNLPGNNSDLFLNIYMTIY